MATSFRSLRIPDDLAVAIGGLHPQIKKKLRAALEQILSDPYSGKALKDELTGLWSLRVGKFRVVYRIGARRRIEIVAFGPRTRIYQETYRLLARDGRRRK